MFWNKSKATWKAAHNIKTYSKFTEIRLLRAVIKDLKAVVVKFKSEEHHKFVAYFLADWNNFVGNPKFYWAVSQVYLDKKIEIFENEIRDGEESIESAKRLIRLKFNPYTDLVYLPEEKNEL